MNARPSICTAGGGVLSLIDGAHWRSVSDSTVTVVNPSNGQQLLTIPTGCEADANQAVSAARRAFDDGRWADAPPSLRKQTLHRFADLIAAAGAELDALDAAEMGKPVREVFANSAAASSLMRFYAECIDKVIGDVYTSDRSSLVTQRRIPRGVVAAVTPWNFPVVNAVRKIAPALAAGNSVVLKPSELSSRSAVRLGELALEAGVPPGVLNVLLGAGHTVGRELALHKDVDMIAFTGSTEVGKCMLQYAGQSNMKVVMAECGGKCPQVVFDDGIDLDAVSQSIAKFLLTNQGQICSVGSRVLVEKSIESVLVERIASHFQQVVIGDALDPKTTFGPLVSSKQCMRVTEYIQSARDDGATLVTGGGKALEGSGGYFVQPTLFRGVSPLARIAREEIFGPVLAVISFEDEGEAIRIANGTMYGLMAYVWTTKLSRGMRMAKGVRSSVRISSSAPTGEGGGHAASSEPMSQSGIGIETGVAGLESYLRRQLVWFNHD